MNESDSLQTRAPFLLCMQAEEQDEALTDMMALAKQHGEIDLNRAVEALAEIHELAKSYLDA
ncbi:hypothetical protein [Paraburkholderia sp. C35]|jgi:hypothetical protein|uniref:hypothetical protein n=1 Tax=Paraburkholderia sp. C35 TaxID=2126993 RepID=UPI000D69CF67|nr:hypothetical protein [Paraburkholderia sp. C35]